MKATQSKAEVYLMALQSLSKAERKAVIARLMDDESVGEDVLDLALIQKRRRESSRPFCVYLEERKQRGG